MDLVLVGLISSNFAAKQANKIFCVFQQLRRNMVFGAKINSICGSVQHSHQHVVLDAISSNIRIKEVLLGFHLLRWTAHATWPERNSERRRWRKEKHTHAHTLAGSKPQKS
jgi:hypothetical protein